jgi:8-oxo-dGTP pyrophosphatase MutT (NUDIX family)
MIFAIFIDLAARFLWNLPKDEQKGMRFMYHIEQMFFYFKDHFASYKHSYQLEMKQNEVGLGPFIREFSVWLHNVDSFPIPIFYQMWDNYIEVYKKEIPVAGALIFQENREIRGFSVLFVEGKDSQKWGFPKGKRNQYESWYDCAKREVGEETGWNGWNQLDHVIKMQEHKRLQASVNKKDFRVPKRPRTLEKKHDLYYVDLPLGINKQHYSRSITPTRIYFLYYPVIVHILKQYHKDEIWKIPDAREISRVAWLPWSHLMGQKNVTWQVRKHYFYLSDMMRNIAERLSS